MKNLLTLLLLCISTACFAQINFEPGYFINEQGIKSECLIKNVAWKNNPVSFEYKASETAPVQTGSITTVKEFSVSGYRFVKHTVDIDKSSIKTGSLSTHREPELTKETLFLKVLAEGDATLYEYEETNLVRYFYSTAATAPTQLVYKVYLEGTDIKYNNMFRQQLHNLMGAKQGKGSIENLKYQKDPLVKLFTAYNGTTGNAYTTENGQNKTILNFKITPGVNFNRLEATRKASPDNVVSDFDNKTAFRIGIEIELILPFNNKKWALYADPNFSKYSDSYTVSANGVTQSWDADYSYIEIPVGVRHYMYLGKEARLFIDAGYSFSFAGTGKLKLDYSSPFSTFSHDPEFNSAPNATLGIGFSYSRFSIEARYHFNRNILEKYIAWKGEFKSAGIILGYRFL